MRLPAPNAIKGGVSSHGVDLDEATWVASMAGFRVAQGVCPIAEVASHPVFSATTNRVMPGIPRLSPVSDPPRPWVVVDPTTGLMYRHDEVGATEASPRTVWFNAAMVGLLVRGGLLLHAAGAVLSGRGLLLLGPSGIGKSTLSRRLEAAFPGSVLCDERIAVRPADGDAWTLAGSPWASSAGIARPCEAPLSALVFLEQGDRNEVLPLPPAAGLARLLPLVSVPWAEADLASMGTTALDHLLSTVPGFVFRCVNDPSSASALDVWTRGGFGRPRRSGQ